MSAAVTQRSFVAPLIGLTLLFAALGPPIGGALFVPLAVILKPPAAGALAGFALITGLLGHTVPLIAAYIVGVGPAAATGVVYALWDAAAPGRWPRALAAAIIGAAVTYAVALRIAALGASVGFTIQGDFDPRTAGYVDHAFSGGIGGALTHAFVLSGAVAGLACAMAAGLIGLTMRSASPTAANAGAA